MARVRAAGLLPPTSVEDLSRRVGGDPQAILEHVRSHVAYDPYAGVLRGARGTVLSAAGNALDQGLLIRALLRHGNPGLEVRLVRAAVPAERAAELATPRGASPYPPPTPAAELARISGLTAAEIEAAEAEALAAGGPVTAEALERIREEERFLAGHLPVDVVEQPSRALDSREHWWARVRAGDAWMDLDPLLDSGDPLHAAGIETDSVPGTLIHRLVLRLLLERRVDGRLEEDTLYARELPVAELAGEFPTLIILPEAFDPARLADPPEALERYQGVVRLAGRVEPTRVFDLEGSLYEARGSDFVKKQAEGFEAAGRGVFGMLSGDGPRAGAAEPIETAAGPALTALRLEFELSGPGLGRQTYRRTILDRVAPESRATGGNEISTEWAEPRRVRLALVRAYRLFAAPAPGTAALLTDAYVEWMLHEPFGRAMLQMAAGRPDTAFAPVELPPLSVVQLSDLVRTAASLAAAELPAAGYAHPWPTLLLHREGLHEAAGGAVRHEEAIDVVASGMLPGGPDPARAARLYGVALSTAEAIALAAAPGVASNASAIVVLSSARRAGVPFRLLSEPSDATALSWPPSAVARLRDDLAAGFVVLAPERSVDAAGAMRLAWWRVDPRTGVPVAAGASGEGQAIIEGTSLLRDVSIPQVERTMKYVACLHIAIGGGSGLRGAAAGCLCKWGGDQLSGAISQGARKVAVTALAERYGLGPQVKLILSQGMKYALTLSGLPPKQITHGHCDQFF